MSDCKMNCLDDTAMSAMSDVWSIIYLTTKDVDLYSLCFLSFILTHLISSIFISSCLDVFARLVLARFSPHGHMSGWFFKNFLKLSPSPRHSVQFRVLVFRFDCRNALFTNIDCILVSILFLFYIMNVVFFSSTSLTLEQVVIQTSLTDFVKIKILYVRMFITNLRIIYNMIMLMLSRWDVVLFFLLVIRVKRVLCNDYFKIVWLLLDISNDLHCLLSLRSILIELRSKTNYEIISIKLLRIVRILLREFFAWKWYRF
jgi:hypothetical protein